MSRVLPGSVMHAHLVRTASTLSLPTDKPIALLDVGCGDGRFLERAMREFIPIVGSDADVWGFDVHDRAVQEDDEFYAAARARLGAMAPTLDWNDRLRMVTTNDPWPFEDGVFDLVTSNQVGEHIVDMDRFLREHARVLRPGGFGIHLFPLREYIPEGHVGLPFAHRLRSRPALERYLYYGPLLRLQWFGPRRWNKKDPLREYSRRAAEYILAETTYRSWSEVATCAQATGFRIGYEHSIDLWLLKLATKLGRDLQSIYRLRKPAWLEYLGFLIARALSSVTVVLEKV